MKYTLILLAFLTACERGVEVPGIPLENTDPLVAQQITNALEEVKSYPHSATVWGKLGMVLQSADLRADASNCFVRAEKLDPKDPRWPYFQGSIDSLKRAASVATVEQRFIRTRLGQMLLEAGQWAEAEEQFRVAGNALGMGQAACAQENWDVAIPYLQQARQSEFSAKAATTLLATVYLRRGKPEEARALSQAADSLSPDLVRPDPFQAELARHATGKRAWIEEAPQLLAQGQVQEATAIIDRLINSYPNAAEGWLYRGRVYLVQNDLLSAEEALARHLQLEPASVDGHLQMGLVYHRQERLPEAAAEFQKAIEAKPDLATGYYFLGVVRRTQGDTQAAARSFKEALRHQPAFEAARKALDEVSATR